MVGSLFGFWISRLGLNFAIEFYMVPAFCDLASLYSPFNAV